jgi:hypothetical protein
MLRQLGRLLPDRIYVLNTHDIDLWALATNTSNNLVVEIFISQEMKPPQIT